MELSLIVDVGSIVGIVVLIIGFVELYLKQQKTKKEIELSKRYLETLSKIVQSHIKRQEAGQQLDRDKFEHEKLKTYGKALGWIWEHL